MSNSDNKIDFNQHESSSYAEVIVPLFLPKNYTWQIPSHFANAVTVGKRVEVSLRNKKYTGLVKRIIAEKPAGFEPKPLVNVLDAEPLVHETQLQLWQWMADYYMCTEGEVMQAAVPSNLKLSSETTLLWNEEEEPDWETLNDEEYIVAEALQLKKELKLPEVQQLLDVNHVYPVIKRLIEKKLCYVWEELQEKYKEKWETYIHLNPEYFVEENLQKLLNNWGKAAPKQMELLLSFLHLQKTEGEVVQSQLLKKSGATSSQLNALIEKNILRSEKRSASRLPQLPKDIAVNFTLSIAQQKALHEVEQALSQKAVCLLHGVTSSGKTQIYSKLIEQYMQQGKQVLYMLPEIALTAQVIRRLQIHFGGHIAIYHSKFNANERVEIWNKIKSGETKAVLGARSALLLPFKDLGLIIVDEEHDSSYKQHDPAPRYHARDTAIYYASLFGAKVLLGSATPSIESYYNCTLQRYGLVKLNERYGNAELPDIEVIDTKNVVTKPNEKVILTPELKSAIEKTLKEKKQVILFKNRRGYSPYMICSVCGWIPHCRNCDVTLTFHKGKNKLVCHYCGTDYPVMYTCVACGSHQFNPKNFGTEKIEETIAAEFPDARTARMDYDSIRGKHDHDTLIKLFEQKRLDILVGTQMVVKGLDFEHVNLVGILDADGILNFADFRVNERAFQLMEQVSGRAGRRETKGKVLIQLANIHHPVLQLVKDHDYESLYKLEIENRRNFFYPPFSRIIKIVFKHKESATAQEAAELMTQGLQANYANFITGPAEPLVNRIRNVFLWEILLKLPREAAVITNCKLQILQQVIIIQSNPTYRSVKITPDVDPV